jgi:cytochrome c-type biogenesis protein CcmH
MRDPAVPGLGPGFRRWMLLALVWLVAAGAVQAGEAAPASADPVLEARVMAISAELRCLVCQNQTIADSHADLAVDLRQQVREMLQRGDNQTQILAYMTARYGDFVLYRPPLKRSTWLLWFGPGILLLGGIVALVMVLRRRARLPDDQFDADTDTDDGDEFPAAVAARTRPTP